MRVETQYTTPYYRTSHDANGEGLVIDVDEAAPRQRGRQIGLSHSNDGVLLNRLVDPWEPTRRDRVEPVPFWPWEVVAHEKAQVALLNSGQQRFDVTQGCVF